MCSNNDNNECGGGGGASLRKNKRPRVPKRGPGVAELERILSEQQQRKDVRHLEKGKLGGSNNCSSSRSLIPTGFQQYSHNYVPRNVTFVPDQFQDHFSNGTGNVGNVGNYNGCNGNNACAGSYGNGGGRGVRIGGSGVVLPEKVLIPANWGSCEQQGGCGADGSRVATGFAFPSQMGNGSDQSQHMVVPQQYPMLNKKLCQFHPSKVNLFVPPTFPASSAPFSAGMCQHFHVEPPSNQRVAQNDSTTWPKEDQASVCKRQWPLTGDNNSVTPSIVCQLPQWAPGMNMLGGSSSSTGNNVMLCLGTPSSSFVPRMEKSVMDSGAPNTSYVCPPSVPSLWPRTCQQDFSKVDPFQLQELHEGYEGSYPRLATNELIPRKPCYRFFTVERETGGPEDTTIGFLNERTETRDVIDLNLKL